MNDNSANARLDAVADLLIRAWHLLQEDAQLAMLQHFVAMALHEAATQLAQAET